MSTGIYGGTFDPVHNAHLELAEHAMKELSLDKVIFIPAYIPPHKRNMQITDEKHRLKMTELAVSDYKGFEVSDIEIQKKGASYTAETLSILYEKDKDMVFIVGADSFMMLDTWYKPDIIFKKAKIACALRDNIKMSSLEKKKKLYKEKYNADCIFIKMKEIDISSHEIREKVKAGENISDLVPDKVYDYIVNNKLYT